MVNGFVAIDILADLHMVCSLFWRVHVSRPMGCAAYHGLEVSVDTYFRLWVEAKQVGFVRFWWKFAPISVRDVHGTPAQCRL